MIEISKEKALGILKNNPYKYLAEVIALESNIPPAPRTVYAVDDSADTFMIVDEMPYGLYVWIKECNPTFVDECIHWLSKHEGCLLASTDKSLFLYPSLKENFSFDEVKSNKCFVCTSIETHVGNTDIRKLTPQDRQIVEEFEQEEKANQLGLKKAFEYFVQQDEGEIYAVLNDGHILGYLSCSPYNEYVWDVDLIYVKPEARGKGFGTQLAAIYAQDKLSNGCIPYYSGVTNPASVRTALNAGFVCCRELYYTEVKRIRASN